MLERETGVDVPSTNPPVPSDLPHRLTGLQRAADHRYDCRRSVENVPGGEAEKSVPGVDQPVLTAVICGEALAVRCTVVSIASRAPG